MRILAGTCVYGLAAGLAESTLAAPAVAEASTDTFVLLLFALYCLAAIQLFRGSRCFDAQDPAFARRVDA